MVETNILFLLFVIIMLFVFLSAPLKCSKLNTEGFSNYSDYYGYYKQYCPSCGWKSKKSCSSCINCGYCITDSGYGECVSGDSYGPYFRDDCLYWNYGNYDYNYLILKYKSLHKKYNLRKPRRWRRWRKTY